MAFSKSLLAACMLGHALATPAPSNRKPLQSRQFDSNNPYANWPAYIDLPLDSSYPTRAAWGVWGSDDTGGSLNHITPTTRVAAAKEIINGSAFPLDVSLNFFPRPINTERKQLVHLFQPGNGYTDDEITLNTQMATQYDSLRHFPYSDAGNVSTYQFYNNLIKDYDEVIGWNHTSVLGIQQAAEKGIAGRGVLLDYKGWMDAENETFNALDTRYANASELDAVAEWQGLTGNWSKPGDILIIRWGWIEQYSQLNDTEKQTFVLGSGGSVGLAASEESGQWLWDKKFALVGSDNPAFEALPMVGDWEDGKDRSLHQVLISGWGLSLLEFINTEDLAPALHAAGRSTFFLTSQPLNVVGGIASPPNVMAVI